MRWTIKSSRVLAKELQRQGFQIGSTKAGELLRAKGYSLQSNRKIIEGKQHPDRNAQFEFIAKRVRAQAKRAEPSISVDTKKKEVLGNKKNSGPTWRPTRQLMEVYTHDFSAPKRGEAIPYGINGIATNEAVVNFGINRDTTQFAVASIELRWKRLGKRRHPNSKRLMIRAASGASNGARNRLWKYEQQRLSNKTGLEFEVCHFSP